MAELEVAASLLYYLYLALGSVSIGYFLVRFAYPEVRVFSPEEKLGASALAGLLITLIAMLADFAVSGADAVLSAKGQPLWFWMASGGAAFLVLKVAVRQKHAEVAIPVTKKLETLQKELDKIDEKPPETQSEITRKLNELRKKGLIPRSDHGDELVKSITPEKPAPKEKAREEAKNAPPAVVAQNAQEARRVIEKAKEAEVDAILKDLNLKFEKVVSGYRRHPRPESVQAEGKTESKTQAAAPQKSEGTPERPRRLYLQHQGQAAGKTENKNAPKSQDKGKAVPSAAPEAKPVTMEDLFGPAPQAKSAATAAGAPVSLVPSVQAPQNCPNCQAKNSRIVFCPYCGTGMCANCSPSITPSPEGFTYQCPKCGEEVPVKRRAATLG